MKDQEETENMEEPRIDKTIYTGRPENTEGRLEKEIAVYDFLDSLGIEYKRVDHEALMTMEACEEVDHLLEAKICKNLFLCNRQQTAFYLFVTPGDKPFRTKDFSSALGVSRVSFATPEQLERLMGTVVGSATVFSALLASAREVRVVFDRALADSEWYGCTDGTTTGYMKGDYLANS